VLERDEREYEEKMVALRSAIAEGDAGDDAEEGAFEGLFAYIEELGAGKVAGLAKVHSLQGLQI
jgi:hypothetical protein